MQVSGLFVYPVKSLRGISLDRAELGMKGLRWDRHWMIVDEKGRFRTQRQLPHMARVSTALDECLVLSAEGCGAIEVPFEPRGEITEVTVWGWTGPAQVVDPRADQWLSETLEMPCRLVAMLPDAHREGWGGSEVEFPDGGAILVAGEASLSDLNSKLEEPVPMNRFRANLVLSGSEPFAEDTWSSISIGDTRLEFAKRCGRCLVTTADQLTGERHPQEEPLRTLARERKFENAACFGSFYAPRVAGQIRVGDELVVA